MRDLTIDECDLISGGGEQINDSETTVSEYLLYAGATIFFVGIAVAAAPAVALTASAVLAGEGAAALVAGGALIGGEALAASYGVTAGVAAGFGAASVVASMFGY